VKGISVGADARRSRFIEFCAPRRVASRRERNASAEILWDRGVGNAVGCLARSRITGIIDDQSAEQRDARL